MTTTDGYLRRNSRQRCDARSMTCRNSKRFGIIVYAVIVTIFLDHNIDSIGMYIYINFIWKKIAFCIFLIFSTKSSIWTFICPLSVALWSIRFLEPYKILIAEPRCLIHYIRAFLPVFSSKIAILSWILSLHPTFLLCIIPSMHLTYARIHDRVSRHGRKSIWSHCRCTLTNGQQMHAFQRFLYSVC